MGFVPSLFVGDTVEAGDVLGTVQEHQSGGAPHHGAGRRRGRHNIRLASHC